MNVPCSSTPAGPLCSTTTAPSVLSSAILDDVDSHNLLNFEAQSHGPSTHCLRFAGWVTPPPRKTRFRMAGQPFRAGLTTRWVPLKGFSWYILLSQASPGASENERIGQSGSSNQPRTLFAPRYVGLDGTGKLVTILNRNIRPNVFFCRTSAKS